MSGHRQDLISNETILTQVQMNTSQRNSHVKLKKHLVYPWIPVYIIIYRNLKTWVSASSHVEWWLHTNLQDYNNNNMSIAKIQSLYHSTFARKSLKNPQLQK